MGQPAGADSGESTPGDVIARIACGSGGCWGFANSQAERDVRMVLGC
ncbi:hypothetical protein [Nocardioides salsibiostraticola]